jgi:PKD domain
VRRAVAALLLASAGAATAAPRLDSVSVQVLAGKGTDVVISVSIERPTLLDLSCSASIEAGDGGRIAISWNIGDSRTKTARYEYTRPGSYRVRVAGAGKDACVGVKEATVNVGTAKGEAKAGTPRCPSGWALVDDSVHGPRFTCRARPPAQPLRCPEGTTYFAEGGEIGCR